MNAKANVRLSGSVAIVDLEGRLTLGADCGLIRGTIRDLIGQGRKQILLNLAGVSYIDSAGLGELVGSYASVTNLGGNLKLLNTQSKVNDLMQVTKLYTVFVNYTDEAEAVRSFAPAEAAQA
jgi:anti-sigma B factor antagonist